MMDAPTPPPAGDLIEHMRFDPVDGLWLIERHLARLTAAAAALGFVFDRHAARNALHAATFRLEAAAEVRLLLARSGAVAIEARALPPPPAQPVPCALRPGPAPPRPRTTAAGAPWQRDGLFDVVMTDAAGAILGATRATLFVERDGRLLTPPGQEGVLRAELLACGRAVEAPLRAADLAAGFLLGTAATGLFAAELVGPAGA